jgi:hypothetical protein
VPLAKSPFVSSTKPSGTRMCSNAQGPEEKHGNDANLRANETVC